jgi:hypothetical protein
LLEVPDIPGVVNLITKLSCGGKLSPRSIEDQLRCKETDDAPLQLSEQNANVAFSFTRYIEMYCRVYAEAKSRKTADEYRDGVSLVVISYKSNSLGDISLAETQCPNSTGILQNDEKKNRRDQHDHDTFGECLMGLE